MKPSASEAVAQIAQMLNPSKSCAKRSWPRCPQWCRPRRTARRTSFFRPTWPASLRRGTVCPKRSKRAYSRSSRRLEVAMGSLSSHHVAHVRTCRGRLAIDANVPGLRNPPNPSPTAPTWRACGTTPLSGSSPAEVRPRRPREQSQLGPHFLSFVRNARRSHLTPNHGAG